VGNIESSLKRTGEKAGCNVRVSPHTAKYTFANDKKQPQNDDKTPA
jgi:site-specific recombinase XerD